MGLFDDIEARQVERRFTIRYPEPDEGGLIKTQTGEASYSAVVPGAIRWVRDHGIAWLEVRHGDWRRVFRPGMLWAEGSGILLRRRGARLKPGFTLEAFFAEAPGFENTPWCWHFTPGLGAMDGLAHKYLGWGLKPRIARYFDQVETFSFYGQALNPKIPDWLDAEYFPEAKAIALYGDKFEETSP